MDAGRLEVTDDIGRLATALAGTPIDAIVGIPRGGLIVAAGLGYALAVDNVSALAFRYARRGGRVVVGKVLAEPVDVFGERVLLVEDGTDTGTLLAAARTYLERRYAAEVVTAALWVRRGSAFRPDVWLDEVDVLPSGRELLRPGPVGDCADGCTEHATCRSGRERSPEPSILASRSACRCHLCQEGQGTYDARCGQCDAVVRVVRGRAEEHDTTLDTGPARCPGSGEEHG